MICAPAAPPIPSGACRKSTNGRATIRPSSTIARFCNWSLTGMPSTTFAAPR
jgi:hypothetical protein